MRRLWPCERETEMKTRWTRAAGEGNSGWWSGILSEWVSQTGTVDLCESECVFVHACMYLPETEVGIHSVAALLSDFHQRPSESGLVSVSAPPRKQQHQASESLQLQYKTSCCTNDCLIHWLHAAPGDLIPTPPTLPSVCTLFWRNQDCCRSWCFGDFWANISCLVTTARGSIMQMEAHKSLYAFWWQQWSEPSPDFWFLKIFQPFVWNWMKLLVQEQLFPLCYNNWLSNKAAWEVLKENRMFDD